MQAVSSVWKAFSSLTHNLSLLAYNTSGAGKLQPEGQIHPASLFLYIKSYWNTVTPIHWGIFSMAICTEAAVVIATETLLPEKA